MPGTLYDPSPTVTPEPAPEPRSSQDNRHVRFASRIKSPAARQAKQQPEESPVQSRDEEASRSRYQGENSMGYIDEERPRHKEEVPKRRRDLDLDRRRTEPLDHRNDDYWAVPRHSRGEEDNTSRSRLREVSSATPPPSTTDSEDLVYVHHSRHHRYLSSPTRYMVSEAPLCNDRARELPSGSYQTESRLLAQGTQDQELQDRLPRSTQTHSPVESQPLSASREDFSFTSASERSFEQQRISELEQEVKKLREEVIF